MERTRLNIGDKFTAVIRRSPRCMRLDGTDGTGDLAHKGKVFTCAGFSEHAIFAGEISYCGKKGKQYEWTFEYAYFEIIKA